MEIPTKECMPCIVSIYLYAKLSQVLTCCNNEYMKSIEILVGFHVFIHHVSVSSSILNLYIGFRWIQILDGFRTQALTCCNNVGFHIFIHHVPVSSSIYIYIHVGIRWIQFQMDLGHTQIAHSYQLECTATQQSVHHHPPQDLAADLSKRPWEHHKAGCCVMKNWQLRASEQPFSIRFPSFQMKINGYHWSH